MRPKSRLIDTSRPFVRVQFGLAAAVVALTGIFTVSHILAADASLTFVPSATHVNIGDTFAVGIREDSGTQAVNAVEADFTYDVSKLQYLGVSEAGSAFGLVAATTASPGQLALARSINGGAAPVTGNQLVTTVNFKVLAAGEVPLIFANSSVVARSSDSVDILASKNSATLVLADLAAPSVPANLAAPSIKLDSVGLTWSASTDNVATTDYRVYRNGIQVGKTAGTSYTDAGLLPETGYSYSVAAEDAAGNLSAQTPAIAVQTLQDKVAPTAPGRPTAVSQGPVSITLTWTPSTDNVAVTGYEVYRNGALIATQDTESLSGASIAPHPTMTVFDNNIVDSGLAPDTAYTYKIVAVDYTNNKSVASPIATLRTLADTMNPSAPETLAAGTDGLATTLTWTASSDDSAVGGYYIYQDGKQIGTSLQTKFVIPNTVTGAHVYTVVAYDIVGNKSEPSAGITVTMLAKGDINKDGKVNVFDLSILLSNWGRTGINASDINNDSIVNVFDLSALLSGWTG